MIDLSDFDPEALADDFPVANADDANRLLWHLRRVQTEIRTVGDLYDAERARLDDWRQSRLEPLTGRAEGLERALEGWARANGAKTTNLSNGVLRLRPPRSHVEIGDASAFTEWALHAGRYDLLSTTPAKVELARLGRQPSDIMSGDEEDPARCEHVVTDEGELVPGVTVVTPLNDRFTLVVAP